MKRQPAVKSVELAARLLTEQQVEHAGSCATPGGDDAADGATVGPFLSKIGLGRHIDVFRADAWDNMAMLARITQEDMKEMGIPMGYRRMLLTELLVRASKRRRGDGRKWQYGRANLSAGQIRWWQQQQQRQQQ